MIAERWQNQEEALQFALTHPSCMLDMEMGTGKTRVAIDAVFTRKDCYRVLVVCPKAVVPVWRTNLKKFAPDDHWTCWDKLNGSVKDKVEDLRVWLKKNIGSRQFIIVNYDSVWRAPMGDFLYKEIIGSLHMVILDESHRAKTAGSKVSKYLAMVGKRVRYKMCLSGTPMANSPLDVYGQYRFLDPSIFGTNHYNFLGDYAIMGGPDRRFIVGFKNQKDLNEKFQSIAYTCKMSDIRDRIKLPEALPPIQRLVTLPAKDYKIMRDLNTEFISECNNGHIVVSNVLTKLIRLQQICSGFCFTQEGVLDEKIQHDLNTAKEDSLKDLLIDLESSTHIVVFCIFKHDLEAIRRASGDRSYYELSGAVNQLVDWQEKGGVLGVQIQAGAEGVDMTMANHAIYYSIPHSLALYEQSKARLYRPSQTRPVSFIHLIAEKTIDEGLYRSLIRKEDVIDAIKRGEFDFGYMK